MENEEKILTLLGQMNNRFDKIDDHLGKIDTRLDGIDARLDTVDSRLDGIDARLDNLENDVAEIKEHSQITRAATNSLVKWADNVAVITQIKFPVEERYAK